MKRIAIISTSAAIAFFIVSLVLLFTSQALDYMIVIALTVAVAPPSIASIIPVSYTHLTLPTTPYV